MSQASKTPPRPVIAPAPPPPTSIALEQSGAPSAGFDPHFKSTVGGMAIALLLLLGIGCGVVFAGGHIAAWMTPLVPLGVDRNLGRVTSEQLALAGSDCDDPQALHYVHEIAQPLLDAAGRTPFEFTFRVARDEQVNAFALPGGYVTVNSGLLKAAETGEEVAGVLGHEIQHALRRHGTRRMLRQMGGAVLLSLFLGGADGQSLAYLSGRLAALAHDRGQEEEADELGVGLLLEAGIDPRGLSSFFDRLSESSLHPPQILSTHPDPGARAERVAQAARGGAFKPLPAPPPITCGGP